MTARVMKAGRMRQSTCGIKTRRAWVMHAGRCGASGRAGRRGARGDWTGAPPGSIGDWLPGLGDGPMGPSTGPKWSNQHTPGPTQWTRPNRTGPATSPCTPANGSTEFGPTPVWKLPAFIFPPETSAPFFIPWPRNRYVLSCSWRSRWFLRCEEDCSRERRKVESGGTTLGCGCPRRLWQFHGLMHFQRWASSSRVSSFDLGG
jgi:hypothetical protein